MPVQFKRVALLQGALLQGLGNDESYSQSLVRHTYRESRSQEAAVHMRPQGQSCAWQDGDDLLGSLAELRLQRG